MRALLAITFAGLCAGCAVNNGYKALNDGDLNLAYRQASAAAAQGDPSGYTNLGVVYLKQGRTGDAIAMYTVAARMGEPVAVSNLAQLGAPIPAADLRQAEPDYSAAAAYMLGQQQTNNGLKPLPTMPPMGARSCEQVAVVEGTATRWVNVCK